MNVLKFRSLVLVLLLAAMAVADEVKLDIRNGVPADAYMAAYGRHNPERDYERDYQKQVWQTIQNEKLPERIMALVMDLLPSKQQKATTSISEELQTIFEPVNWSAVANCPEAAYGQVMEVPQTHHLVLLRLPSVADAATIESSIKKLNRLVERRSDGAVVAAVEKVDGVALYTLGVPKIKDFPFQPAFARMGDVIVFSSSAKSARQSINSLLHGGPSKFDDPRLQAALDKLPKPEDALMFYDGRQQFQQLRGIGQFIREKAPKDAKAVRFAGVFERVIDELAILDYQVTVESTEGHRNIKTELGQLVPGAQDKILYKVCASGKPFENWQHWVPADAQAYSLRSGANLHILYEWLVPFIRQEFPEAKPALNKFEHAQQVGGVQLDCDILQAFSGEFVAIKLPASSPSVLGGHDKVVALRCEKPDRIRELIHQGIERLEKNPYAQSQQLKLAPCKELEGFDELSANLLGAFGVRPVIGFHKGWMIVASNAAAAEKVLRTLSGDAPSIDTTKQFKQFGLHVEGPVYAISYSDLATSARQAAQLIRQAGLFAPMILAAAGEKDPHKLKPLQDAVGLLPSIANVVEKIDYLQSRLSVTQKGDAAGSYVKRSVTLVRAPKEK